MLGDTIDVETDANIWKRLMVSYTMVVLLCAKSHLNAWLKYLSLVVDETVSNFTEHNWCEHIETYFHNDFSDTKDGYTKGVQNVVIFADMHLLMVCFSDKYGGPQPDKSGPSCSRWDNGKFRIVMEEVKMKSGSTYRALPEGPTMKLPKPFKEILHSLPNDWKKLGVEEQGKVLEWCEMAKKVLNDDISTIKQSMASKRVEDGEVLPASEGENVNVARTDTSRAVLSGSINELYNRIVPVYKCRYIMLFLPKLCGT